MTEDPVEIERAKMLAAGPLGEQMGKFPLRFAKAAFFGERPSRKGTTHVSNGTLTLVDLGEGPMAITCSHVISGYRDMKEKFGNVVFQIGNVDFDPLSQLIAEDAPLDLATIALKHEQIGAITADGEIGSCVFRPVAWPPPALSPGEFIAFGGFPGRLRERPSHDEVVFPSWSSGGSVVASVSEDRFSCQFEREFWVASFGAKHHMELRDLGGLSGGPAFIHRGLYWDFVGVIYEFSQEFDIMFFRPGYLIDAHGLIHGSHV